MSDKGLSDDQIDRMVKDANFVSGEHPYAPNLFDDLCCHVRALASEVKRLREAESAEQAAMCVRWPAK
jgi:hypothetical protein